MNASLTGEPSGQVRWQAAVRLAVGRAWSPGPYDSECGVKSARSSWFNCVEVVLSLLSPVFQTSLP